MRRNRNYNNLQKHRRLCLALPPGGELAAATYYDYHGVIVLHRYLTSFGSAVGASIVAWVHQMS